MVFTILVFLRDTHTHTHRHAHTHTNEKATGKHVYRKDQIVVNSRKQAVVLSKFKYQAKMDVLKSSL